MGHEIVCLHANVDLRWSCTVDRTLKCNYWLAGLNDQFIDSFVHKPPYETLIVPYIYISTVHTMLYSIFFFAVYRQHRSERVHEEFGLWHKDPSGKVSVQCPSAQSHGVEVTSCFRVCEFTLMTLCIQPLFSCVTLGADLLWSLCPP